MVDGGESEDLARMAIGLPKANGADESDDAELEEDGDRHLSWWEANIVPEYIGAISKLK